MPHPLNDHQDTEDRVQQGSPNPCSVKRKSQQHTTRLDRSKDTTRNPFKMTLQTLSIPPDVFPPPPCPTAFSIPPT